MKTYSQNNHLWFDLGLFFLMYITILLSVSMLLFFIGITIGVAQTLISLLLTILIFIIQKRKNVFQTAIIAIVVASLFIVISGNIVDTSYDGNSYRKPMVGLLKEGWNPVYETPEEFNAKLGSLPKNIGKDEWKWLEFFPKGMAILGASIYAISENIETGKAYHFMTMFMIFCFLYDYLKERYFNKVLSFLVAVIATLNPVALSQMRSFYVDAPLNNMAIIIFIFILCFFDINYMKNRKKEEILSALGFCVIIGINTKFNALYSIGVICIAFFAIIFWKEKKKSAVSEMSSLKIFLMLAVHTLFSIFVGYAPYVTNYLRWQEVLPGVIGTTLGHMSGSFAASTDGLNIFQIFWVMLFGKMGDFWGEKELPLKVPFTVSTNEMSFYYTQAPHFGAYGIFFSGLFIVSVIVIVAIIYKDRKTIKNHFLYKILIAFLTIVILQCSLTPLGAGGLRYTGYFYLIIPIAIFLMLRQMQNTRRPILMKFIAGVFIIGVFINIIPWGKVYVDSYIDSLKTKRDLSIISQHRMKNGDALEVGFVRLPEEGCSGYIYNLKDSGIEYFSIVRTTEQTDKPIYYTCGWQLSFYLEDFLRE